jgi:hypothetical protein
MMPLGKAGSMPVQEFQAFVSAGIANMGKQAPYFHLHPGLPRFLS